MTPGPVRILHVLASLGIGGIETYLMNLLRTIDPALHRFDFLLNEDGRRWFDREASERGAVLHRGPSPHRPVAYGRHLRRVLAAGRYDVVHSHMYTYSGLVLAVAARAGVARRIAHVHTFRPRPGNPARRAYQVAMRLAIGRYATHGLAPTTQCAEGLFGAGWRSDGRFRILPMGFDFEPFGQVARDDARARLAIPADARVLAHIGGHSPQKNHPFLLEVLARLRASDDRARLLLLTREPAGLAAEVARQGLGEAVTLVPPATPAAVVLAAADLFVLPSLWEGLPVVALEAQAAGTPVLGSPAVPDEAVVVPGLVHRLELAAGAGPWAAAAAELLAHPPHPPAAAEVTARYGVDRAWEALAGVYGSG